MYFRPQEKLHIWAQRGSTNHMMLRVLLLCVFLVSAQFNCDGYGVAPRTPVRNPYVCTPEQLRKAAIAMTLQFQSYVTPWNPTALFNFVPPSTPVFASFNNTSLNPPRCCQNHLDLYHHFTSVAGIAYFIYTNQVPMTAVISEVEGVVKVYAGETVMAYVNDEPLVSDQVIFVWKPMYQCHTIPDCNCNLELVRLETRTVNCQFNEPMCPAHD